MNVSIRVSCLCKRSLENLLLTILHFVVTAACGSARSPGTERWQNILNKQLRTDNKGFSSDLAVGQEVSKYLGSKTQILYRLQVGGFTDDEFRPEKSEKFLMGRPRSRLLHGYSCFMMRYSQADLNTTMSVRLSLQEDFSLPS
jgi:hypothetical protein